MLDQNDGLFSGVCESTSEQDETGIQASTTGQQMLLYTMQWVGFQRNVSEPWNAVSGAVPDLSMLEVSLSWGSEVMKKLTYFCHKLETRLPAGEISTTSDMQMIPL